VRETGASERLEIEEVDGLGGAVGGGHESAGPDPERFIRHGGLLPLELGAESIFGRM